MITRNSILVVDDQMFNRMMLKKILGNNYVILEAENGQEALEMLTAHEEKIAAVVLDLIMPKKTGIEFLEEFQNIPEYHHIPVIVATGDSDASNEQKCLELGAWDFISKPYNPNIIRFRISNAIERSRLHKAEHDALTGLYNKTKFLQVTRQMLNEHSDTQFVLIRFDLERFKMVNTFFSRAEGDRLLKFMAACIEQQAVKNAYAVYGRIEGDVFCVCHPYERKQLGLELDEIRSRLSDYNADYYIEPAFGIYVVETDEADVSAMMDKAALAVHTCKGNYMKDAAFYDNEMSVRLVREQHIINEMDLALEQEQFQVYLQPKYKVDTRQPCGAEALVRWIHPKKGIIFPGEFIPVFEKNGFIGRLDFYMWEHVCRLLRKWIDEGRDPQPVSVNISRVDIYNPSLVDCIIGLAEKYDIPAKLLNLELTESAVTDNQKLIIDTIERLHQAGFIIMMDDFGSGYSSLNVLKDILVDYLKVDMKFLPTEESTGRSEKILTAVVKMAKWLNMTVIVEGVERKDQVTFLQSIGADYIQGYFFAKPMPVADYERLMEEHRDTHQEAAGQITSDSGSLIEELWRESSNASLMFEHFYEPAAMLEMSNGKIELLRVNFSFLQIMGEPKKQEGTEDENQRYLEDRKWDKLHAVFRQSAERKEIVETEYMRYKENGEVMWVHLKLQPVSENENSTIFIGFFSDITNQKKLESEIRTYHHMIKNAREEKRKILIVDDEEMNREIMSELFSAEYEILNAENGAVALDLLQEHKQEIAVVLLDLFMPVMDGTAFLKVRNCSSGFEDIPVIAISAESSEYMQSYMMDMGVNDYVTKPFVQQVLKQRVHNVIAMHRRLH